MLYQVDPDPRSRSRSRASESLKIGHFENLSPSPFVIGFQKFLLNSTLQFNIKIWSLRIFDITSGLAVTWPRSWPTLTLKIFFNRSWWNLVYGWYSMRPTWICNLFSDPRSRSRSRASGSLKIGHFENLSPSPFVIGFRKFLLHSNLQFNYKIWSLRIFDSTFGLAVTWPRSWPTLTLKFFSSDLDEI